jgi:hypothetical protein
MPTLSGGCHCGNLQVALDTERGIRELATRACLCSFCTAHGARSVSDPQGRASILIGDDSQTSRYRFGLSTADFMVCKRCGVYVGAVMEDRDGTFCVINVNALRARALFDGVPAQPVDYDGESAEARVARRKRVWTPCSVRTLNRLAGSAAASSPVLHPQEKTR